MAAAVANRTLLAAHPSVDAALGVLLGLLVVLRVLPRRRPERPGALYQAALGPAVPEREPIQWGPGRAAEARFTLKTAAFRPNF
jgi:hypothetical protein